MITTDAESKIKGVSLSKVELVVSGSGDMSLKVRANLVSDTGAIYGAVERVGGWSENVIESIEDLAQSLESFLLSATFDVGEHEDGKSANRKSPKGILGS